MKKCYFAILTLFISAVPALAVTVNSPTQGDTVTSPFTLSASAATCSSKSVVAMGYSLDNGSDISNVKDQAISFQVSANPGIHTIHVKAWGKQVVCVKDIKVTVMLNSGDGDGSGSGSGSGNGAGGVSNPVLPPDPVSISSIQALSNWKETHDTRTSGNTNGSTSLVATPSRDGGSRMFITNYTNAGGERFSVSFGDDTSSTNFLYDAWVYVTNASNIANLEMDMNQVMANGQTVIYSFQCAGYSGTWEYGTNAGTPDSPQAHWISSKQPCNVRKWSTNTWHHVQISYSRNDAGTITYHAVYLDGVETPINATVPGAFSLGWAPSLSTNLQVDGLGKSGTATVYLDDLVLYRW